MHGPCALGEMVEDPMSQGKTQVETNPRDSILLPGLSDGLLAFDANLAPPPSEQSCLHQSQALSGLDAQTPVRNRDLLGRLLL